MNKLTALDLTPFYRHAIGMDRVFDRLMDQIEVSSNTQNYPPYNIVKTGENTFEVQVAVAGFAPGEIDVNVRDSNLVVTGERIEQADTTVEYLHHGIGTRKFIRTFSLADHVEVVSATVKNGILVVSLERKIPDALQPKSIAITYE